MSYRGLVQLQPTCDSLPLSSQLSVREFKNKSFCTQENMGSLFQQQYKGNSTSSMLQNKFSTGMFPDHAAVPQQPIKYRPLPTSLLFVALLSRSHTRVAAGSSLFLGQPSTTICGFLLHIVLILSNDSAQKYTSNSIFTSSGDHEGTVADSGPLSMGFITVS